MDEKKSVPTQSEFVIPELTPEIVKKLAEESQAIRTEFRRRIEKMWIIPPDEWRRLCR